MRKINQTNVKFSAALAAAAVITVASAALLPTPVASASTQVYWNGTGTSWNSLSAWSTASNATTPYPTAVPGSGTYANFNINGVTSAQTVDLNASQQIQGMTFNHPVTIAGGSGTYNLTMGAGGGGNGIVAYAGLTAASTANIVLADSNQIRVESAGAVTVNGNITGPTGGGGLHLTSHTSAPGLLTINGVIADGSSGSLSVNISPSSGNSGQTVDLNGSNTFTGALAIGAGDLVNVASLGNQGPSAIGEAASGSYGLGFAGGTLQYTGSTPQSTNHEFKMQYGTTSTIDASGSVSTATVTFNASGTFNEWNYSGARELVLTGTNMGRNTFGVFLADNGGSTSLTKDGTGMWVVNGGGSNDTYTGSTDVTAGEMIFDSTAASSAFSVASAATLAGDGSTGSLTVNTGGILAPGDNAISGTTLTAAGGATLANSSVLDFTLGTPNVAGGTAGSDLLKTTTLSLGAGITVNVTQGPGFGLGTYSLIDFSGTLTGNFTGWTVAGLPGGETGAFSIGTDNGASAVQLTISSVPEPASLALLAVAGAALLLRSRRKRA